MNWYEYIEEGQYDYDWSDDTFDIAKQAYIAGLQAAYDKMKEYGDFCFNMQVYPKIEEMIKESE
jgi:hypothetical protein